MGFKVGGVYIRSGGLCLFKKTPLFSKVWPILFAKCANILFVRIICRRLVFGSEYPISVFDWVFFIGLPPVSLRETGEPLSTVLIAVRVKGFFHGDSGLIWGSQALY